MDGNAIHPHKKRKFNFTQNPGPTAAVVFSKDRKTLLNPFYQEICQWKYNVAEEKTPELPQSFPSPDAYIQYFLPVLYNEIKAEIKSAFLTVDKPRTISLREGKQNEEGLINLSFFDKRCHYKQNIVLVTLSNNKYEPSFLGIAQSIHETDENIITALYSKYIELKTSNINGYYNVYCLNQLSTVIRQYLSLLSISNYKLVYSLLNPRYEVTNKTVNDDTKSMITYLTKHLNPSQRQAIEVAMINNNITLIQGPPGTGKTQTLLVLLNLLHIDEYHNYQERLLEYYLQIKSRQNSNILNTNNNNTQYNPDSINNIKLKLLINKTKIIPNKPRILVTAPSNSAVDEVIERIMRMGFKDRHGNKYFPRIIRVGAGYKDSVLSVSIENQIHNYESMDSNLRSRQLLQLRTALEIAENKIHTYKTMIDKKINEFISSNGVENLDRMKSEKEIQDMLTVLLDKHTEKDNLIFELTVTDHHILRDKLESTLLDNAEIIFTTLSSSGLSVFDKLELDKREIGTIVIDEAAQCVELETIIPLRFNCQQCILIGDPQQLPATILSQYAILSQYNRSLFERLSSSGHPIQLLNTQYRSHPKIMAFPSQYFYNNQILSPDDFSRKRSLALHELRGFSPFVFFSVAGREKFGKTKSYVNYDEADFIKHLISEISRLYPDYNFVGKVGIITPYKEQMNLLKSYFQKDNNQIEVGTVDSYQGKEKDIIILSCVRGNTSKGIGFVDDIRRMNVSLTRAKFCCWVVGNSKSLSSSIHWKALLDHSYDCNVFIPVDFPFPPIGHFGRCGDC